MGTKEYNIGETGTLGFPVSQYDGTPIDTAGLDVRLTVYRPGDDVTLLGTWISDEIDEGSGPITHTAIASFAVTPETFPLNARPYKCALEINDGTGWRVIGNHLIDARKS